MKYITAKEAREIATDYSLEAILDVIKIAVVIDKAMSLNIIKQKINNMEELTKKLEELGYKITVDKKRYNIEW